MNKTNLKKYKNLNNCTTQDLINLKNFDKDGVRDILADKTALPLAPSSEGERALAQCKNAKKGGCKALHIRFGMYNTSMEERCKKCLA